MGGVSKLNYARNFNDGIFKTNEARMEISATVHVSYDSEAKWMSKDINSALQRFIFTHNNGLSRDLRTITSMTVLYEFSNGIEPIEIDWPITNPEGGIVETILPTEVLSAGQTGLTQHVYLNQETGSSDVGNIGSTISISKLDSIRGGVK
jgi:hypothetical protein